MKSAPLRITSIVCILTLGLLACGRAEKSPSITVAFAPDSASYGILESLVPSAFAAAASAQICFKRLRFKTELSELHDDSVSRSSSGRSLSPEPSPTSSPTSGVDVEDHVELRPGRVELGSSESSLGVVALPAGTYTRIELDLEPDCLGSPGLPSVAVQNTFGRFATDERVKIVFRGRFDARTSGQRLVLGTRAILTALESVPTNGDIRARLEALDAQGGF